MSGGKVPAVGGGGDLGKEETNEVFPPDDCPHTGRHSTHHSPLAECSEQGCEVVRKEEGEVTT